MRYICDKCKKELEGNPVYISYGLLKGDPFYCKLCPECKKTLTSEEISKIEENNKIKVI